MTSAATLRDDYAHCFRIARHAENFPVASRLLPRRFRPHLAAIYAYARGADDIADEPRPSGDDPASRLAALDAWEAGLDGAPPPGTETVFRALDASRRECALPEASLRALLRAFRYDVRHQGYADWNALLAYAQDSAASVGRLVLAVAGERHQAVEAQSDDLCVALQLTNFWQDLSVDVPRGRLTLPETEWSGVVSAPRWRATPWTGLTEIERDGLARALDDAVARTELLYERARPLPSQAHESLRVYLGAVWEGGSTVLARVRELGRRAFTERTSLRWSDRARIGLRAVVGRA